MLTETVEDECMVMAVTKVLGKKWTVQIICELLMEEQIFFTDLKTRIESNYGKNISARVLSDGLSRLEDLQIVQRNVVPDQMPIRVSYALTEKGNDCKVIFSAIKGWGLKWGGIEHKKCKSMSCIHNSVPIVDIDQIKGQYFAD